MSLSIKNTSSIVDTLKVCIAKRINFAAYKLPGKDGITLIIQKDPEINELGDISKKLPERGFLIAPFSRESEKTYLIRPDYILYDEVTPQQFKEIEALPGILGRDMQMAYPDDTLHDDYFKLIGEALIKINAGEFEKVVLSRVKSIQGDYSSRLSDIFDILCNTYKNAFVYLFCLKGQCWTGATPEPFICSKSAELFSVSLAGTRTYSEKNLDISKWNAKELQEQEFVTRHIDKVFLNYSVSGYKKDGPYTISAGNLLHLRTDFTFSVHAVRTNLPSLIHALHPTPAVCGMSTGKAMDFIKTAEKHSREYYTGFLGPLGINDLMQLYVNLRCMKVMDNRLVLYIGGGITIESIAEEEWEETEIKADTLLSVLQQIT